MASESERNSTVVLAPSSQAQKFRLELEKLQLWDETRRLMKVENNNVAIPVKPAEEKLSSFINDRPELSLTSLSLPASKKVKVRQNNPALHLQNEVKHLLKLHDLSESLLIEVPLKWERHGDLVIIPSTAFASQEWDRIGDDLWRTVTKCLASKRLARHSPIADDGFRSSQVVILHGTDGLVISVDNGIRYSYDVTKCMFSVGNITEKLRVASFNCSGETVVDLYAGIGYFTLPYLVHANASHVHACEWNPEAVKALKHNLELNNVADRCTVHEGDNTLAQIPAVADRVNLGLIPSSEKGWPIAVRVLKPTGGVLHVHGNISTIQSGSLQPVSSVLMNRNGGGEDNYCHKDREQSSEGYFGVQTNHQFRMKESVNDTLNVSNHLSDSNTETSNFCSANYRLSGKDIRHRACQNWSSYVQRRVKTLLEERKEGQWTVIDKHLEIVKSYAPHILHCVLDLECRHC